MLVAAIDSCRSTDQNSPEPAERKHAVNSQTAPNDKTAASSTPESKVGIKSVYKLPEDWRLSLKTSGGIAGQGAGSLTVNSSGAVIFEERVRPPEIKTCRTNLSIDETQNLRNLIAEWQTPVTGDESGPNIPVPDAFTYKLEISSGTGDRLAASEWFDNTFENLPPPDKALIEALSAQREKVRRECSTGKSNHQTNKFN